MAKIGKVQEVAIADLVPYANNAKMHGEEQVQMIADSIKEFGFLNPVLIDKDKNIIAGHGRVAAAKLLGMDKVPTIAIEGLTDEQRRAYILADNRLTELGEWDKYIVSEELKAIQEAGIDINLTGFNVDDISFEPAAERKPDTEEAYQTLKDRFLINPFTILDSRSGDWVLRKRAWKNLGIKSEIGRGNDDDTTQNGLVYAKSFQSPGVYKAKNQFEALVGRKVTWDEYYEAVPDASRMNGTSIFDPVLCEIAYRWFCPEGGKVIDPFAGGSVRGIVASLLGRRYTGVDLSERQIKANEENWDGINHITITDGTEADAPSWFVGDSCKIDEIVKEDGFDFMFTCPPYADLEKYSDRPEDLSNKPYDEFLELYKTIIKKTTAKLKKNSFAVCVVGDVRDKKGYYRNFISDTIQAFQEAGLKLYNEAILVTTTGSIAMAAANQFEKSRKLAKHHQNVMVFVNPETNDIETIRVEEPEAQEKDIGDYIKNNNGKLVQTHKKVIVFANGDAKAATENLGSVDTNTIDDFYVDLNM